MRTACPIALAVACAAARAAAQDASATPVPRPSPTPALRIGGYVETYYQWNANRPSNGVTALRGFDLRHDAFTISNIALEAQWTGDRSEVRLTLQAGATPDAYYAAEGDAATRETLKHVQQAWGGVSFDDSRRTSFAAGLFLSPIGPESMAVRDSWNFSRSNLFVGLPFFHVGARLSRATDRGWTFSLWALNGWNNASENNAGKTFAAQAVRAGSTGDITSFLYMAGPERPTGAAEGAPIRHLFDVHRTWVAGRTELIVHANGGLERSAFGRSSWIAAAAAVRREARRDLFVGLRADAFRETSARHPSGVAGRIFWPVDWVASATGTLDVRPAPSVSIRAEARHDRASGEAFFGREASPGPRRRSQTTVTLGFVAWF